MSSEPSAPIVLLYMVDEDELVALSARLASLGFQVMPVGSLDEGRRACTEHQIDCAFVEVRETHRVGLSAIRNFKLAMPLAPVVVLSSNKDVASRIAGRDAGAEHYLATPIRNIDLEMRVAELRQAMRQLAAIGPSEPQEPIVDTPTLVDDKVSESTVIDGEAAKRSPLESAETSRVVALEAVPLPQPRESEQDSQTHRLPLPEPDTELAGENQRLLEVNSQLKAQVLAAQKSEAAALRDRADILQEMHRRDRAAQLGLTQARTLVDAARAAGRSAPSIAGGHPPDTDELTGLIGVGPLQDHLDREFARARRYGHTLSVLMLDLDRLARYDKSYGQTACDRALCLVADVLRSALRSPDIAARVGDDDFVVLATDTTGEQALLLAERLRAALRDEGQHTSQPPITVSIGIASTRRQDVKCPQDLLKVALEALRQAKETGRDRSVVGG